MCPVSVLIDCYRHCALPQSLETADLDCGGTVRCSAVIGKLVPPLEVLSVCLSLSKVFHVNVRRCDLGLVEKCWSRP